MTTLEPFIAVWLTLLGLVVGSFLNVVIARVPAGESVVSPRSRCPRCGHSLPWYENIPVFSWLWLRAKCSGCQLPISARYPLVELLTGALFLAAFARFGVTYPLAPALLLVSLLIPLTFIDAEHWILPHELTVPGTVAGVLIWIPQGADAVLTAAIGAVLGFLVLRLLEYVAWLMFKKEALGGGDKFLFALIGAYLGPKALLAVLMLASLQASVFGVAKLLLTGRAGPAPEGGDAAPEPAPPTMTWAFLRPGLTFWQRLARVPYAIFLQPIPDDPVDLQGEEIDWTPGATNLPLGPWLSLAALEVMYLGPLLARGVPVEGLGWIFAA